MDGTKTYVITLARTFQKGHPREGEETCFKDKFLLGLDMYRDYPLPAFFHSIDSNICFGELYPFYKIHTIRANFPLWERRIREVREGRAVLSVRQWSGRPYASRQETLAILTDKDDVDVQEAFMCGGHLTVRKFPRGGWITWHDEFVSWNDGLSVEDWKPWFAGFDRERPARYDGPSLAVIHFTGYRYM